MTTRAECAFDRKKGPCPHRKLSARPSRMERVPLGPYCLSVSEIKASCFSLISIPFFKR